MANSLVSSLEASNPHFPSINSTPLYMLRIYLCVYVHININIFIHTHTHTHTHTHILYIYFKHTLKKLLPKSTNPEQIHTYIHTYLHTHTHTQNCPC